MSDHSGGDYRNMDNDFSNVLASSKARSRRSKFIVVGMLLCLAVVIAVGVGVGVTMSKSHNRGSSGSGGSPDGDYTNFEKDPNLHQSFYGIAYTPEGSQLPNCGNSLENVIKDIQLLSQLTTRIRLYGADCDQAKLVMEAIEKTKVNMTVFLGNYPIPDDNSAYTRQRDALKDVLQTYGSDHVGGITVGNEFMLNYLTEKGITDPNSAAGNTGAGILIADINDTRSMLDGLGMSKIPVGNSDAGSYFNDLVLEAVDYGMSNVHAWFANASIDHAADWVAYFFETVNVEPAAKLSNNPKMYIAETGWPSESSDKANANNGPSDASEANLQIFLDTFVCQANQNGTGYFYFEASYTDEKWKDVTYGGVEGWWGLFHQNRTLKSVTIPICPSS
ncbi:glycoside hydrolase [Fistulina hepatica ATCC 64428]|nr:glycoside hydrolase [Fistulina hepatica ATCC 64428]